MNSYPFYLSGVFEKDQYNIQVFMLHIESLNIIFEDLNNYQSSF